MSGTLKKRLQNTYKNFHQKALLLTQVKEHNEIASRIMILKKQTTFDKFSELSNKHTAFQNNLFVYYVFLS